jgi:hypothetical protein
MIIDPRSRSEKTMGLPISEDFRPHNCKRPAWQEGYCSSHFEIAKNKPEVKAFLAIKKVIAHQQGDAIPGCPPLCRPKTKER